MQTDSLKPLPGQTGLSLIELMIALTIGLLIIGTVSGVFLTTSRNYSQDERVSRMQENARYAMHVLTEDLSMGGYWGPLITGEDINTEVRDCTDSNADLNSNSIPDTDEAICQGLFEDSVLSIAADCGPGSAAQTPWLNWIDDPIESMTNVSKSEAVATYPCIEESEFEDGSDILVVKRVEGQELASTRHDSTDSEVSDEEFDLFVRTDGNEVMLFEYREGLDVSEGSDTTDWPYRSNLYYIRSYSLAGGSGDPDGIPTLVRRRLDGDGFAADAQDVAQGIESFRIMFGIDTDGDATADVYKSAPTLDELENTTSARIFVLARSLSEDPLYENDKTYQLGDWTRDFSADPDGFYRRVFSTTVTLRNQRNRILTVGG